MADTIKTNLGPVTAYADAKAHGYTGTREEFGVLLANAGNNADAAAASAAEAKKTLESIPADYSTLSGKVDDNTSGINELKEDLNALKETGIPSADIEKAVSDYLTKHPVSGGLSEAQVNSLIDNKLGVIENGSY